MKNFLILIFGIIAIWDAFTTFIGVYSAIGRNDEGAIYSIVVSFLVFAFMIGTTHILEIKGIAGKVLKAFWIIAVIVDVITSFFGNAEFLNADNIVLWLILIFATLLTSASGIIVSYVHSKEN